MGHESIIFAISATLISCLGTQLDKRRNRTKQMFKMSSLGTNARCKPWAPFTNSLVDHALLHVGPEGDQTLLQFANIIVLRSCISPISCSRLDYGLGPTYLRMKLCQFGGYGGSYWKHWKTETETAVYCKIPTETEQSYAYGNRHNTSLGNLETRVFKLKLLY